MRIIPANFKLSSFKTLAGDRGDRLRIFTNSIIIIIILCSIDSGNVDAQPTPL